MDEDVHHMGFFPQCGICEDTFVEGDGVMALFGSQDSTLCKGHTVPFPFPKLDDEGLIRLGDSNEFIDLCPRRGLGCASCPEPGFASVHCFCYDVFTKECTADYTESMSRLLALAVWKHPWRRARPLHLPIPDEMPDPAVLEKVARKAGLPQLSCLPLELTDMIRRDSKHAWLWKGLTAARLAAYVSNTYSTPLRTLGLTEILSWERNGNLERVAQPSSTPATVRLTIDSRGISKVERLASTPLYSGECSNRLAFVVVPEASVSGVIAQLKDGLLRLLLPNNQTLPIWNTPAPPDAPLYSLAHIPPLWPRFFAVEMSEIQGITFFFAANQPCGIHIHTSEDSCALSTFENLDEQDRLDSVVWNYLPITKDDRVTFLGTRGNSGDRLNFLVRTNLAGDVVIGPYQQSLADSKDRSFSKSAPITFIYSEPTWAGYTMPFIGAYGRPDSDQSTPKPFPRDIPSSLFSQSFHTHFYSWAPLSGISSTLVLYDRTTGFCRGILFYYQNGGARAVGDCRLHVDSSERVVRPDRICFKIALRRAPREVAVRESHVQVKFKQGSPDQAADEESSQAADEEGSQATDEEDWESKPLEGVIRFWFTYQSSYLVVEN